MSLLTIAQNVADEVGAFSQPSTVINNTDSNVKKLLALINRTGKQLMKEHNWKALQKLATFNTVASTATYDIETNIGTDFDRFVSNTFWDDTNNERITRIDPAQAAFLEYGLVGTSAVFKNWYVRGANIVIEPTPTAADSLATDFISKNWVENAAGSATYADFSNADTDVSLIDENLIELGAIWRLKRQLGVAFAADLDEYQRAVEMEWARDGGAEVIFGKGNELGFINIQDGSFPAS